MNFVLIIIFKTHDFGKILKGRGEGWKEREGGKGEGKGEGEGGGRKGGRERGERRGALV